MVGAAEDGNKVVLERLNRSLGGVATMIVGWDQLVVDAIAAEVAFVGRGRFVVQPLVGWCESTVDEILSDGFEGADVFNFRSIFHGGSEDGIAVVHVAN